MNLLETEVGRVERRRLNEQAWLRYLQDGTAPLVVRPEIARSWSRARAKGVDPKSVVPQGQLAPDALCELQRIDETLRLCAPLLAEMGRQLTDHVIAYFDARGWMLAIEGARTLVDKLAEIGFRPGVDWSEPSAGTNAPGSCLAERTPLVVEAAEHFVAAWQPWSCAATPLIVHGGPAPLGAIDITAPWDRQSRRALPLVQAVALAVQERLQASARLREEVLRHALRQARDSGDALVAIDKRGGVLGLNDAATRRRLVGPGGLSASVLRALEAKNGSPWLDAESEVLLALPEGTPLRVAPVRFEGIAVGAILRAEAPAPGKPRCVRRGASRHQFEAILGDSPAILRALALGRTAARNDLPVVISGESGTGKEMFAHSLHNASSRAGKRFVVVNCGAIPEALIEAELFGYEQGAFTGARQGGNSGRFEDADEGTLFLDEVSELPAHAQVALLRLVQEKEVVRLGSSAPRRVDARVVAATNKPLEEEVQAGRFRSDLYYRLNVLPIAVPPLRERGDDVCTLAATFIEDAMGEVGRQGLTLSADALAELRRYDWPGNVRELRNLLLRSAATAPDTTLHARDLLFDRRAAGTPPSQRTPPEGSLRAALGSQERHRLVEAIEASSWNLVRAAHALAISRATLYRLVRKYGLARPPNVQGE